MGVESNLPATSLAELQAGLRPALAELEAKRKRMTRQVWALGLLAAGGWAAIIGGYLRQDLSSPGVLFIGILLAFATLSMLAQGMYKAYHQAFKVDVIGQIIRSAYPEARFLPSSGLPQQDFVAAQIYKTAIATYEHEDLIEAKVGNTRFRMSDVHARYRGFKNQLRTLFQGVVIVADFPKPFKGRTVILPEGCFGDRPDGLQAVTLERSAFERDFVVYSSDQIEARYLLSPTMMERLVRFSRRFPGDVRISFANNQVLVAIDDHANRLEAPPLFTPLTSINQASLRAYLEDVWLASTLVEDLNLNLRIWSSAGDLHVGVPEAGRQRRP